MLSTSKRAIGSRRRFIAAWLTAVAVLLSACSSGDGDSDANKVDADDLVTSMSPATGEIDTLNWNLFGEPETIDPANTAYFASGTVVRTLCDSLSTMEPDYVIKPSLATSEVVSPTKIVFTIRSGATFWDGKPVTAEDVAYSLNRTMDPKFVLSFIFVNVESIKVTGPDEVTVNFTTPDELFLNELPNIGIVQKAFTENVGDDFGTASGGIMCSGPYKLVDWAAGNSLTVTRNDDYWNPDLEALAETIKFSFVSEATALTQALDSGEIDGGYEIPASSITALSKSSTGRLTYGPSTQGIYMYVATPDGPTADNNVRQAFQRALDRDAIAEVVFKGSATPNYTSITPATWPPDEKSIYQPFYDTMTQERSYDLEAAKELVEASSYDGTPIVLAIQAGDTTTSQIAQLVQQQAKQIGLNVEIKTLQPLVFAQAGYDAAKRTGIDMMISPSFNGTPDPLEPLGFLYLPGQPYNYTNFDDPTVTRLLTDARASFDGKERAEMVVQAQEIIEADSAVIPIVSLHTTTFLNNDYTGAITSFAYWSSPALAHIGSK